VNCNTIGELQTEIDDKDIGDFGEGPTIITREFGNAVIQIDEPLPPFPETLGLDTHDTYRISCFFGHVGSMWQGMTNVLLHRGTPVWEAVEEALGRKVLDIGIFNVSEDRTQFGVCWKRELY
jgi:hypothetical protein